MTLHDRPAQDPATEAASEAPGIVGGMCPFLLADGGAWRAGRPLRELRCTAVVPAGRPSLEKQRRLCLVEEHVHCPFYQDAIEERARARGQTLADSEAFDARVDRRVPRSAAVALDRPTSTSGRWSLVGRMRGVSRLALAGMMVAAVALLVVARFLSGAALGPAATPTPSASPVASASPNASPTTAPTLVPTATPAATASPVPTPSASPARTYTVQSRDTLSGIADKFNTTVAVLKALNGIVNVNSIDIGQVLLLP